MADGGKNRWLHRQMILSLVYGVRAWPGRRAATLRRTPRSPPGTCRA
jgi:hypothetical protein